MPEILSRHSEAWKTVADAAPVVLDPVKGHRFYHSGSTARTFSAPGAGYDGQQIMIAMKNTNGGIDITHTFTTGTSGAFRFGAGITGLTSIASDTTDYVTAVYHAVDDRWDVVGYVKGY